MCCRCGHHWLVPRSNKWLHAYIPTYGPGPGSSDRRACFESRGEVLGLFPTMPFLIARQRWPTERARHWTEERPCLPLPQSRLQQLEPPAQSSGTWFLPRFGLRIGLPSPHSASSNGLPASSTCGHCSKPDEQLLRDTISRIRVVGVNKHTAEFVGVKD